MSHNHVIELPNKPKQRPISCDYAGGRFRLTDEGLTFIGIDKDGNPLPPRWICSPLYVVAKTRDAQSGEWGRLLEWQDDDGITHQWAMPLSLLLMAIVKTERLWRRCVHSLSPMAQVALTVPIIPTMKKLLTVLVFFKPIAKDFESIWC